MSFEAKQPFEIKVKLAQLRKKQVDLIPILNEKYHLKVSPPTLSQALSGTVQQPKYDKIVSAANEIVSGWEHERAGTA